MAAWSRRINRRPTKKKTAAVADAKRRARPGRCHAREGRHRQSTRQAVPTRVQGRQFWQELRRSKSARTVRPLTVRRDRPAPRSQPVWMQAEATAQLHEWMESGLFNMSEAQVLDYWLDDSLASHYKVGHNKFSDWTQGEYQKLLGYAAPAEKQAKNYMMPAEMLSNGETVADSIDWRDKGYVG